jgi:DNA-directed RNA polymerase specialized sigma24 family protein
VERRVIVRGRLRAAREAGRALTVKGLVDEDDPFIALLDAWLDPAMPAARWSVVVGVDDDAEAALQAATAHRESLVVRTGSEDADALLADLSPVLGRLLDDLTSSQRRLARLLLVEGVRQADAAEVLGISRASVSVANGRARIHEIELQLRAVRACWAAGRAMSAEADVAGDAR